MNTPASTSTAAMSSRWKVNQPATLRLSKLNVPTGPMNVR